MEISIGAVSVSGLYSPENSASDEDPEKTPFKLPVIDNQGAYLHEH